MPRTDNESHEPLVTTWSSGCVVTSGRMISLYATDCLHSNAAPEMTRNAWPSAMTGSVGCHAPSVNVWVTYAPEALSNNCTCRPSAVGRPSAVVTPPSTGVIALRNAAVAGMAEAKSPCNATP